MKAVVGVTESRAEFGAMIDLHNRYIISNFQFLLFCMYNFQLPGASMPVHGND